tara:strand:- start:28688 stop:29818 length:1131 start_codon:yes stop_codon:yes gene_type:complete
LIESKTPINRIIIVGNGFDLSLGLKTSYADFLHWYVKETFIKNIQNRTFDFETIFHTVKAKRDDFTGQIRLHPNLHSKLEENLSWDALVETIDRSFNLESKNNFAATIADNVSQFGWVDIEDCFFSELELIFNRQQNVKDGAGTDLYRSAFQGINNTLNDIKIELDSYIHKIETEFKYVNKQLDIYHQLIKRLLEHNLEEKEITYLILNFNYTKTFETILQGHADVIGISTNELKFINIHGSAKDLQNPIVFGYGDDTSEVYKSMENHRNNEIRKHIKSFYYPNTDNYSQLLGYLESGKFEVHIIGHSCGVSDKTLLNTIFEHDDCLNIKNYHQGSLDEDFNKRLNISRHFSDKQKMRERIANYDSNAIIPQIQAE